MPQHSARTSAAQATIAALAQPRPIQSLDPIAARFIYSLRLIALHQKAKRDPVPELAVQLSSLDVAAKALALSHTVSAIWPEDVHVSRFCCCKLTHDEGAIADMIEAAVSRDRPAFDRAVYGLIRPDRTMRLWDAVLDLVEAEFTNL